MHIFDGSSEIIMQYWKYFVYISVYMYADQPAHIRESLKLPVHFTNIDLVHAMCQHAWKALQLSSTAPEYLAQLDEQSEHGFNLLVTKYRGHKRTITFTGVIWSP